MSFSKDYVVILADEFQHKNEWLKLQEALIPHHLNLNIKYFDISEENMKLTEGKVLSEAIEVSNRHNLTILSPLSREIDLSGLEEHILTKDDSLNSLYSSWLSLLKNSNSLLEGSNSISTLEEALSNDQSIDKVLNILG